MNGEMINGISKPMSNGILPHAAANQSAQNPVTTPQALPNGFHTQPHEAHIQTSGDTPSDRQDAIHQGLINGLKQMPPEIQHITQGYLRLSKLVERSAQQCWNGLVEVVEKLSQLQLPEQSQTLNPPHSRPQTNGASFGDQSKENLDKKDGLLKFAQDQRTSFIKLLVLSQWGQSAGDIQKVIDLHSWIVGQRINYTNAADFIGFMKRDLALAQTPNPDLKTALEVFSSQRLSEFPDLGYSPEKKLKPKQILKTLRSINSILCSRLVLYEALPLAFHNYRIHDGRVTFSVATEFELDLSIADEDPTSQFYFIDFRFTFEPCTNIFDARLYHDVAARANDVLKNQGLLGCYEFLHDLTLSYKINVLYKQALELARGQWSENLRVDMIHRTLVVQYWTNRTTSKSWVEIGIRSDRREAQVTHHGTQTSHLDVRWMQDNKEVEDALIQLDTQALSMESILHQITASHASHILDSTYERMLQNPLYSSGHLSLELSLSSFEPNECFLQLQLTMSKKIILAIESVSGAVVLKPASALLGRLESELSKSKNLAEDTSQRFLNLRCVIAEQDLTSAASSAGWEVLRTFKLSPAEFKTLFNGRAVRYVFFRRVSWESEFMLAATQGLEGGRYWLAHAKDLSQPATSPLIATPLGSHDMEHESSTPYHHFIQLWKYSSGYITLQLNASYLNSLSVRNVLPDIPEFAPGYILPNLSFEFQPAKLKHIMDPVSMSVDWAPDRIDLEALRPVQNAWVRETVSMTFCGLDPITQQAVVLAKGRSSAPASVLTYIQESLADTTVSVKPTTGELAIRLMSPVGKPVIDQLLDRLFQLETLIACVTVIKKRTSLVIQSISSSRAAFLYRNPESSGLGVIINFATSTTSLQLEFTPEKQNPHSRIASQLTRHLARPNRPLHSNLSTFIPILKFTLPLLSLLDELQAPADSQLLLTSKPESAASSLSLHLHVLPRDPKMYGIQYFGPSSVIQPASDESNQSSIMLARFEILPLDRKGKIMWILRPAIEEYESYTRKSYCSQALKDRLRADVFGKRDPDQGWQGLDSGAACPIEQPEKLLRRVDEVIRAWVKEAGKSQEQGQPPPGGPLSGEVGASKGGSSKSVQATKPTGGATKNEQQPKAAPSRQTGTNNNQQQKGNVNGAAKGGAQKAKEVITLD